MPFGDWSKRKFVGGIIDDMAKTQRQARAARQMGITSVDAADIEGDLVRNRFIAQDEQGRVRIIMSDISLLEEFGVSAYLLALDIYGNPQAWMDADTGQIASGGGDVTLGDDGAVLLDHLPLEFKAYNSFIGDLYSSYIFGENVAGRLTLISGAKRGNTNLIVDGGFESGVLDDWDVTSCPGAEIVSDRIHAGSFALHVGPYAVPYQVLASTAFSVTPGNIYLPQLFTWRETGEISGAINFFDSGGTYIIAYPVFDLDRATDSWQRTIGMPIVAPAGAATAKLIFNIQADASIWMDDIRLVDAGAAVVLGSDAHGWLSSAPVQIRNQSSVSVTGDHGAIYSKEDWPYFKSALGEMPLAFTRPNRLYFLPICSDFISATDPFDLISHASGTSADQLSVANHPGIIKITSAAIANSGVSFYTSAPLLPNDMVYESIFQTITSLQILARFGFTTSPTSITDGAWIDVSVLTLTGKTSNAGTSSTTGTSYTISTGTWYRAKVTFTGVSSVLFELFDESGTLLWSDTLTTNIPTAAIRAGSYGIKTGAVAGGVDIMELDWHACYHATGLVTR